MTRNFLVVLGLISCIYAIRVNNDTFYVLEPYVTEDISCWVGQFSVSKGNRVSLISLTSKAQ